MRPTELRKLEGELHEFLWEMFEDVAYQNFVEVEITPRIGDRS
jgi:hypothetical protein